MNVSTEDVVIHEESSSSARGHQGPFTDDIGTLSRDQDALYDVQVTIKKRSLGSLPYCSFGQPVSTVWTFSLYFQVQKQIQRRLEDGDRSIDRSSNNSRLSSHNAATAAGSAAAAATAAPSAGQNGSFSYHSDLDRYSNSSFGSSQAGGGSASQQQQQQQSSIHGNQLIVEADDTNPWK